MARSSWLPGLALLSACTINGTAFGAPAKGGSTTTATPAPAAASPPSTDATDEAPLDPDHDLDLPPPRADRPRMPRPPMSTEHGLPIEVAPMRLTDPWQAVVGEYPRWRFGAEHEHWSVSREETPCTAAVDHCLPIDTWIVEWDSRVGGNREAFAAGIGKSGSKFAADVVVFAPHYARPAAGPTSDHSKFTAYRTVPATRKNLVPGTLVFALRFERLHPGSPNDVFESGWRVGPLERIDYDLGVLFIKGWEDPVRLTSARVAVLSWRLDEKVQILGGKKRDELAVSAKDVFVP